MADRSIDASNSHLAKIVSSDARCLEVDRLTSTRITSVGNDHALPAIAHRLNSSFVTATPTRHNLFLPGTVSSLSSMVFRSGTVVGSYSPGINDVGSGSVLTVFRLTNEMKSSLSCEKIGLQLCRYPAHRTR
jgi:hypothetical protein